jgi:hypothetical protein
MRREFRELLRLVRLSELGVLVVAFAAATLLARLAGAGWGTASGFGQMAFVVALVAILLGARR